MAIPVHSIGSLYTPATIPGQGCLAQITTDTEAWIIEEVTDPTEIGDGTHYPIGMTLDHLMELYWRWKTMHIDITSVYKPYDGETSTTITSTHDAGRYVTVNNNAQPVDHERQLILPADWEVDETAAVNSPSGYEHQITLTIFDATVGGRSVKFHNNQYYPYIRAEITLQDQQDGSAHTRYSEYLTPVDTSDPNLDLDTSSHIKMSDGTEYTLPMIGYGEAGEVLLKPFTMVISASEYFPHAKPNGSPKYDTITGAKL